MRATFNNIIMMAWALAGCTCSGRGSQPDASFDTASASDAVVPDDRPRIKGSGLQLHWNVDVRWLDPGAGIFAAVAIGTHSVELIGPSSGGGYSSTKLAPPQPREKACGVGFPVALTIVDADGDGQQDVAVFDPACGHWLRLTASGHGQSVNWNERLPALPNYHFFDAITWDSSGSPVPGVYAAHTGAITGIAKIGDTWSRVGEANWSLPSVQVGAVTDILVRLPPSLSPGTQILFQRGRVLQKIVVADDMTVKEGIFIEQMPEPKYTRGFDGFDHLEVIEEQACGIAAGVGIFGSAAGNVPRRAQLLKLEGDRIRNVELATPFEVVSFAAVRDGGGTTTMGFLGRDGGRMFFASARLSNCASLEAVQVAPEPLPFRTMFADQEKKTVLAPTDGIKILARLNSETDPEFLVYDGFTVFTLQTGPGGLVSTSHSVHTDRSDLIWGME